MKGRANGGYIVMAAPSYFKSVNAIRRDDQYANELPRVVGELQRQPFRNPKLQTHPLRGVNRGGRKTFASYVGGPRSDRRIVWQIANRTVLALLYGPHEIYNRVKRLRIDFDDKANRVLQYETGAPLEENEPKPARDRTFYPRRQPVGDLFILWSDSELREFGLPQAVVRQLRCLNTEAGTATGRLLFCSWP